MTVGISSFALANEEKAIDEIIISGCTIVTTINVYDSCGNLLTSSVVPTEGFGSDCANADTEGFVWEVNNTKVKGCKKTNPENPGTGL